MFNRPPRSPELTLFAENGHRDKAGSSHVISSGLDSIVRVGGGSSEWYLVQQSDRESNQRVTEGQQRRLIRLEIANRDGNMALRSKNCELGVMTARYSVVTTSYDDGSGVDNIICECGARRPM